MATPPSRPARLTGGYSQTEIGYVSPERPALCFSDWPETLSAHPLRHAPPGVMFPLTNPESTLSGLLGDWIARMSPSSNGPAATK